MKKYAKAIINFEQSRRDFLGKGAILGASAVAVAALPNVASAIETPELGIETKKEEGYRLTQHIADYYKSATL